MLAMRTSASTIPFHEPAARRMASGSAAGTGLRKSDDNLVAVIEGNWIEQIKAIASHAGPDAAFSDHDPSVSTFAVHMSCPALQYTTTEELPTPCCQAQDLCYGRANPM